MKKGGQNELALADPRRPVELCSWCRVSPVNPKSKQRTCSRLCRQAAARTRWLFQERKPVRGAAPPGLTFAYADPPYPKLSRKYYAGQVDYRGEVDHRELIARLEGAGYDGWALSTSAKALREILPLCPPHARVCAWVKPIGVPPNTMGLHSTWEPLIVVGGRKCKPGVRDWFLAQPARNWGELAGRKPIAFCVFLVDALGMITGDDLIDVFPGTGMVSRVWAELSRRSSTTGKRPALQLAGGRRRLAASLLQAQDAAELARVP